MFKCTGNCQSCGRCYNIFENQVEKNIVFPQSFLSVQAKNFTDTAQETGTNGDRKTGTNIADKGNFGIAFDIGTTTLAAVLWDLDTKEKIQTIGGVNPQRLYGADVISRIAYCHGSLEKRENLRVPLVKTLENMAKKLIIDENIAIENVRKAVFCGNTTMTLLFAEKSTDGLAHFPFEPDRTFEMNVDFQVDGHKIPAIVMAGISGHIGGDITASMLAAGYFEDCKSGNCENTVLLDLGTNGEVIANLDGQLYGFSTAAGPAFEGANISCGMAATTYAIENVQINENGCQVSIIKGSQSDQEGTENTQAPVALGLCGSGIMSTISGLLKMKLLKSNGDFQSWEDYKRFFPYYSVGDKLRDEHFVIVSENMEKGQKEISINQEDVRQLQTAKAAILAGFNTLFKRANFNPQRISKVYLAGGFSQIAPEILEDLNIFPFQLGEKLCCIGNGALTGASMVLLSESMREKAREFSDQVIRIELGSAPEFQEEFMGAFDFKG